jgi:hypothetical protein
MATMRAVQVAKPGGPVELVERPVPEPGRGSARSPSSAVRSSSCRRRKPPEKGKRTG